MSYIRNSITPDSGFFPKSGNTASERALYVHWRFLSLKENNNVGHFASVSFCKDEHNLKYSDLIYKCSDVEKRTIHHFISKQKFIKATG